MEKFNTHFMIKKLSFLCLVLFGALLFSNCEEEESIRCFLDATNVSSNSPVLSGGSILLVTPTFSVLENIVYEWSGPNGFVSNLQNPILLNSNVDMAGEYSLKIKLGICETEVMTTEVEVIQNTVTCTPVNNTATFTGGNPTASFYNFNASAITDGRYSIDASDNNWRIKAIFLGNSTPQSGIYSVTNISNELSSSVVHIIATRFTLSGTSFDYNAKSGDISVSYVNGNAVIKFCSVPFSLNNQNNTDFNCTTQFTQN